MLRKSKEVKLLKLVTVLTTILILALTISETYAQQRSHHHVNKTHYVYVKKKKRKRAVIAKHKLDKGIVEQKFTKQTKHRCSVLDTNKCHKQYLAYKAKLEHEKRMKHINSAIRTAGNVYDVSPRLIKAIAHVESKFNKHAENGPNKGIMQVNMSYHRSKFKGQSPYNIDANVMVGTGILKKCLDKHKGSVNKALVCYNGGGDPGYVKKVRKQLSALKAKNAT